MQSFDYPHRRFNPLTQQWVLVSPHRAKRPWQGQVEKIPPEDLPTYDPGCYLCPGNPRAGGHQNPPYQSTFVFENDFSALLPEIPVENSLSVPQSEGSSPLFVMEPATGRCRVVCFSPRHDLSLPQLSQDEVEEVIRTWRDQTTDLGSHNDIEYVQVFENKGAMMGCSNPHPHSQIWGSSYIPDEPAKELSSQTAYLKANGACLLCTYTANERDTGTRVVAENEGFTALVPFWAVWPFEIMLISHRHFASLPDLEPHEISTLADILRQVTTRYDNLFGISFPYSMGFHQAPSNGDAYPAQHFHAHFYPPLLRSATVRKFMVGYEMLGMPQRDLTPETAAERLRSVSEVHYRRSENKE